ncbi:MAG: hypothetical protein AUJ85_01255 [Elusimicrobia bacterium CG1_02_37_114]|nr:MAG: hypothetical protein AUJ85_01255 [Elusimicrobia bacterium CG1_02_37_114]PIV53304.1 MAG: hypothetical protein COS17_04615 [Elusimicrobia bacterium CG02_land_8_20_14_3_00_37_13]
MLKKSKTDNQFVTSKEFNETKKEFIERFDKIENNMATKDDIKRLDEKIDTVDKKIDTTTMRLYKEIIKNSEAIENLKETVATKDDIQRIISSIDSLGSQTKDHGHTAELNTHRIKELEPKVENHEKRIGKLESHLPPAL